MIILQLCLPYFVWWCGPKHAAFTSPLHPVLILVAVNCTVLWTNVLTTASSSDRSSNVTRSWQNDRETTFSTSDWTNTTAAASDDSTSFEDDKATRAMLTTSAPSVSSFWQYQACYSLFDIGSPILMVLATVGNTLSLITLQNPTLHHNSTISIWSSACQQRAGRQLQQLLAQCWEEIFAVSNQKRTHQSLQNPMFHKSSTSFILSALAFCDLSTVNVILLHLWLIVRFGIDIQRFTSFGCKLRLFLAYYTHHVRGAI